MYRILLTLTCTICLTLHGTAEETDMGQTLSITMATEQGDIVLELYTEKAPKTTSFFLDHMDAGGFDGATIYRAADTEGSDGKPFRLIQGGQDYEGMAAGEEAPYTGPTMEEVENTDITGLSHTLGTISLARDIFNTGHVVPEFFICAVDITRLNYKGTDYDGDDRGFPAFGRVTEGMEVVEKILTLDTDPEAGIEYVKNQVLSPPVKILSVSRTAAQEE